MRAVAHWIFWLILGVAVSGGATAWWFTEHADEVLCAEILKQLHEMAPGSRFSLARANFDFSGRVRIRHLTLTLPEEDSPALVVPEAIITLDRDRLADNQDVVIERIRVVKPQVRLSENRGQWNWSRFVWIAKESSLLPILDLEHAAAMVERCPVTDPSSRIPRLDDHPAHTVVSLTNHPCLNIAELNVQAIPANLSQYTFQSNARLEPGGHCQLRGKFAVDGGPYAFEGSLANFAIDDLLINRLLEVIPELETSFRLIGPCGERQTGTPATGSSTPQSEGASTADPNDVEACAVREWGLELVSDLAFRVERGAAGQPPLFQVSANIHRGQLTHQITPLPLFNVKGRITADNWKLDLNGLMAQHGASRFQVSGRHWLVPREQVPAAVLADAAAHSPLDEGESSASLFQSEFIAQGAAIEFNEAVKSPMPAGLRRIFDALALTGRCDVAARIARMPKEAWRIATHVDLTHGTLAFERFPYPVRDVTAALDWRGNRMEITGSGKAGSTPVEFDGEVLNPGPAAEAVVNVHAKNLPIDQTLVDASPGFVKETVNKLSLQGRCDFDMKVIRPSGLHQKFEPDVRLSLRQASLSFQGFPYRVTNLTGTVHSAGDVVRLEDLHGLHDGSELRAEGVYQRGPAPGKLNLTIWAKDAPFDRQLELALNPRLQQVWAYFSPRGKFDTQIEIEFVPGQPVHVDLPLVVVRESEVTLRDFLWPLSSVAGRFQYINNELTIQEFTGWHEDTRLSGSGQGQFPPDGPWRVVFDDFHADDVICSASFRRALPSPLREACETLDPRGRFSASGPCEFWEIPHAAVGKKPRSGRGGNPAAAEENPGDVDAQPLIARPYGHSPVPQPISQPRQRGRLPARVASEEQDVAGPKLAAGIGARWDLMLVLAGNSLNAGVVLEELHGRIRHLRGEWDGAQVKLNADLELDTLTVFNHELRNVRGPIALSENILTVGSRKAFEPPASEEKLLLEERVSGDFIDGRVIVDGVVRLQNEPDYRLKCSVNRSNLEKYAQRYLPGVSDMRGIVNGWIYLQGRGANANRITGNGELVIQPAALYELPIFVQMLKVLNFEQPDRTAFERAELKFSVRDSRFLFNPISLEGSALSLYGVGYVRFDGITSLDFGSRLSRNQVRIPVIHEIVGMMSRGVVGVEVRGRIDSPNVRIKPVPELNEALQQFFGAFDARPIPPARKGQ